MIVILGTAHSKSTPGKRSPDETLREYAYSREICKRVRAALTAKGVKCVIDIEGDEEISLQNRCNIVNRYCDQYGKDNCIYISIHVNAAGSGKVWMTARGWSGYVYTSASSASKTLAKLLCEEALKRNLRGNRSIPVSGYRTANFWVLAKTKCPAVLTENLFQDNKEDVKFLLSEQGKKAITDLHVEGILNYLKTLGK